jgi:hypothetical protein
VALGCVEEWRNTCKILVGRPEGKRPFWKHGYRLEDNIKVYLREGGYKVVNSTELAKDRIQYQGFVMMQF